MTTSTFSSLLLALAAFQSGAIPSAPAPRVADKAITLDVFKSTILENANGVKRVATSSPEIAEAVAVSLTEVMVNGKAPGETSLILWDNAGGRTTYDVKVLAADTRPSTVRDELTKEFPGADLTFHADNGIVYLRGTVSDGIAADRAASIVSPLGKVVNLLRVSLPPEEPQILLRVRFADVDRTASTQLGLNLISTNALNTPGSISTGQISPPTANQVPNPTFNVPDPLNIFFYRPDLNIGATLAALVGRQLAEILAEPNLLTISGRPATFLSGGEFPFPTLQGGGSGIGQITIQFHEFGIRLKFLPIVTPRGTIRMKVAPEVSSLDYGAGLTVDGITVPGLATRRVETEVELRNGQSFVIGGLIDNRLSETIDKIPGLSSIPLLGKLFQSKISSRNHSELLVIVTPEIVRPIEREEKKPEIPMDGKFLPSSSGPFANPVAAPDDVHLPHMDSVPVEVIRGSGEPTGDQSGAPAGIPMQSSGPAVIQNMPAPQPNGSGGAPSSAAPNGGTNSQH